ncbi:MAG: ribonuclease R [Clostridia bacterium]|nr:ribonuclease R [Clostridia bacterium]
MNAKQSLTEYFLDGTFANKTVAEIIKILQLPYRERGRLISMLETLIADGVIFEADGRYGTAEQLALIKGTLSGNERGFAFLMPEDKNEHENDYFIAHKNLHGALHGDVVFARRIFGRGEDEAEVVKIISRGYTEIVGTFYKDRYAGYLCPDERRYSENIYIPLASCRRIKNGVKAVARINDYPYGKAPSGEIIEVLGNEDDFFAEELSIIRSYNLREEFPEGLEREAERQEKRGIHAEDLIGRSDLREKLLITIDGADTRDIDDAVSLERDGENYVLGVHIADVSHYVKQGSPLDKEAYKRGTSAYFPDRVLPMLPRALSNGICSLNEGEDRLALSCVMTVNKKGTVKNREIVKSVIRSKHKMTYTEVSEMLDGNQETIDKYADVADMIRDFAELTELLINMRNKRGSVELDIKEAKILYENGEISIPDYERPFSHRIIEQFMVLANETVAEYMHALEAPFIYRIHEKPAEEKAENFRRFAQSLGLTARFNAEDVKPYDYRNLLKAAEGLPAFSVLNRVMLRSMQKARYSPLNVGHFGLASDCYCHFTSPIRRYPDLCIHRIIKDVLDGNYALIGEKYGNFVSEAAIQASETERKAAEAEREVDALYITMYMSERIGEEYDAVVSGVTSFGVFAELPNTAEGLIPLEDLEGEFELIPEKFLLRGTKQSFSIGQSIRIRVEDVDFYQRRTRFSLIIPQEAE